MPEQVKNGLLELQAKAADLLRTHFTPAQRYGTAFHITSPFADLRQMNSMPPQNKESVLAVDFEALDELKREKIFSTLNGDDPYLLWYVAQANKLPVSVLVVKEGQQLSLQLNVAQVSWVFLEKGARLNIEQRISGAEMAINRLFVWQEAGSELTMWGLRAENTFLSEKVEVRLQGLAAQANVRHLTFGTDRQQSDMQVNVYHEARETASNLVVRTAAADHHTSIYRGLIDIKKEAQGSKGYQSGHALLLSRQAVVDNLPELAIRTNDVQCSHGVTTTHIDDEALFYMRSRGIGKQAARRLAMTGFYHDKMEIPEVIARELETVLGSVSSLK